MYALVWVLQVGVATAGAGSSGEGISAPVVTQDQRVHRYTVAEVLRRVDAMDPRLREKAALRLQAEVGLRRARWDRVRPAVGAYGGYSVGSTGWGSTDRASTGASQGADGMSAVAYADLRVPIFTGGRLDANERAAVARVEGTTQDWEWLRQEAKRDALVAYAYLVAANSELQVAQRALDRAQSLVKLATARRDTGVGSSADVARSQLNTIRRQEDLSLQQTEQMVARSLLKSALLLAEGDQVETVETLEALASITPSGGAGSHPELKSLQAEVMVGRAEQSAAQAAYLPSVEVFGNGQYGKGMFSAPMSGLGMVPMAVPGADRFGPYAGSASAGVMVTWRAFDGYVTRDQVDKMTSAVQASEARLAEARRQLKSRVDQARVREGQAAQRLKLLSDGMTTAKEAVRLATARYETGTAILTEVLDAEPESIGLESRQVQAAHDWAAAHIERIRAEGWRL